MPFFPADGPATYGSLTVSTTAVEVKVGASPLSKRVLVGIQPLDGDVYMGYDSSVTTSTGVKLYKGQYQEFERGEAIPIYIIAESSTDVRISEFA